MGPSRFCRPHLENCCLARVADSCSRGAFPCSVAYVGFRVWLLGYLYGPVICAFTVCSPPASHTTPHSWFHLKPLSYLLIGLLCPKCIVGSTLGLFHSLRPLRMCCFVLHGTVHSLRPPVQSCPFPHWSTELRDPAWSRDPRALCSAARGAGSAASCGWLRLRLGSLLRDLPHDLTRDRHL